MEDKKQQIVRLIKESAKPKRKPSAAASRTVRIEGNHNIIGDGNTVIHARTVRRVNRIDPTKSELSEAQKMRLRELLNAWIDAHNTIRVRARPLTHAAAWSSFQRKFSVTSYHYLPAARFEEACAWLQQKRAQIDGMKTAPRRDPDWRRRQIAYIKARCKNQLGDEQAYLPYISTRFGKTSLADLTDDELARTKAYIAHKKTA